MRKGYSKFLTVTLIIIIVAVIGLIGYLGYDYYTRLRTNQDASDAFEKFAQEVAVEDESINPTDLNPQTDVKTEDPNTTTNEQTNTSTSTKAKTYKGFNMLGTIEIPKTGAKYPILEKETKKSLETSVAVIWPEKAELNKPGNVVIVGHNYRNGTFFTDNKKISKGDKIYIRDLNNNRVAYTVYKIFEASENETSFYNRDTDGKKEITLSTCTDNNAARLIIQAREE